MEETRPEPPLLFRLRDSGWCDSPAARRYMAEAADEIERLALRRAILPQRRVGLSTQFEHRGVGFAATIGFYPDGALGELFLSSVKAAADLDIYARDLGMAISAALQFGAPPETLARMMTRDTEGAPQGLAARALDLALALARDGEARP
jgi:hypothetical protein